MLFGSILKSLRIERQMTQDELGKLLNKSSNNISQYETSKREPDLDTLTKISEIFEVSLDYLIGKADGSIPQKMQKEDFPDVESQFKAFIEEIEGPAMFYQYENWTDDEKLALIGEYDKQQKKKQKKVNELMDYPDDIIDDAIKYAKFTSEKRKQNNENE